MNKLIPNEKWKPILGYENYYEVSNIGRVKSLSRRVKNRNGYLLTREVILKNHNAPKGYHSVGLCKNSIKRRFQVHRLVAQAFILNIENKPCVNHINGNTIDNRVENLEWCTHKENTQHAFKTGLRFSTGKGKFGYESNRGIEVHQYDKNNKLINSFGSMSEASRETGVSRSSINLCVRGKYETAGGYVWKI